MRDRAPAPSPIARIRRNTVLLSGLRPPRFLTLPEYFNCDSVQLDTSGIFRDWAYKSFTALAAVALGADAMVSEIYRLALLALQEAGIAHAEEGEGSCRLGPGARRFSTAGRCHTLPQRASCQQSSVAATDVDLTGEPCQRLGF